METLYIHVYLLLIIGLSGVKEAYTSTTVGKKTLSGQLNTLQVQERSFTRASCYWDQADKSVTCRDRYLRTIPDGFPETATGLDVAHNEIRVLLNTSFEHYRNLITLNVTYNGLETIQPAAFQPLKYLMFLNLEGNKELVIPNSFPFRPLEALVSLDLGLCNQPHLPNDLLDWFPNLRYLILWGNRLSSLNVSRCKTDRLYRVVLTANRFQDLSADKLIFACPTGVFDLTGNPIRYISEEAIAQLPVYYFTLGIPYPGFNPTELLLRNLSSGVARSKISHIRLANIDMRTMIGIFTPLNGHRLVQLIIEMSGDIPLSQNFFFGLNCLYILTLHSNTIRTIEPEYFQGMPGLTILSLIDNYIVEVNPHKTIWKNRIENLRLQGNKIGNVWGYQLLGLNNLTSLNLSRNAVLSVFVLYPNHGLDSLKEIDLTGTCLIRLEITSPLIAFYFLDRLIVSQHPNPPIIPGQTFNGTKMLEIIDLSHSKLTRRDIWGFSVNVSLFRGLRRLNVLHLSRNSLGNLPGGIFQDNLRMGYLAMAYCNIRSLSENVFNGLNSLVNLDLSGNNLYILSAIALKNLPSLGTLTVDRNEIMVVEEGAMEKIPHLKNLSLSNNRLVAFNRSTWNTLMNYDLDYIDVSGNPLSCVCKYGWLYDLAISYDLFRHHNETLCSDDSLSQLRGKPLLEFDPGEYCVQNIVLLSTIPFVVLALLIGLLLTFHNRWLIRYKLFLVKLAIVGYIEMQDAREHDEFVFDLNIMFTEDDEVWAKEHLRPSLEERLPEYGRYSFGDEDLTLGMHYLDAVHYAVDHSFKTILLLSRRAVQDNWFLIKFRIAVDHVHDELTENTVVIFLEDIPEDEIPYLVRLYLSDRRPYMRWPEDVRGHEYFWNQLTKIVTVNLKYNPMIPPE